MIIRVVLVSLYLTCFRKSRVMLLGLRILIFTRTVWTVNLRVVYIVNGLFTSDLVSTSLIVLSVFVAIASLISANKVRRDKLFGVALIMVFLFLICAFIRRRFFFFFFFFEAVLIPLVIIILGWGYQPERLQACRYIVIYTLRGSLMFLLGLSILIKDGMRDIIFFVGRRVSKKLCGLWWVFCLGFIIKLPMYPFHLWLPKAHVEAPVAGSMLLAGVVLKLGGYGLIRFIKVVELCSSLWSFWIVLFVNLLGGFYAGLVCFRQVDLKCLVAYSSVSHISLVILGLIRNSVVGVTGGLLIIIGHGLCSSGLFRAVNVLYKNRKSRLLILNKGYLLLRPVIVLILFLLRSSNIAAPPSLNLLGEIIIFIAGNYLRGLFLFFVALVRFIGACYRLFFYYRCSHGKSTRFLTSQYWNNAADLLILQFHWVPLNFLFLFSICVID